MSSSSSSPFMHALKHFLPLFAYTFIIVSYMYHNGIHFPYNFSAGAVFDTLAASFVFTLIGNAAVLTFSQ